MGFGSRGLLSSWWRTFGAAGGQHLEDVEFTGRKDFMAYMWLSRPGPVLEHRDYLLLTRSPVRQSPRVIRWGECV